MKKMINVNMKVANLFRNTISPVYGSFKNGFKSDLTQRAKPALILNLMRLTGASYEIADIINVKGTKVKVRVIGNPTWKISQYTPSEDYEYELYFRFSDDASEGVYFFNRLIYNDQKFNYAHGIGSESLSCTINSEGKTSISLNRII